MFRCRRPSLNITRSPEKQFEDVHEPFRPNYLHVKDPTYGGDFRVHYLDEGDPEAREVCPCIRALCNMEMD